LLLFSVVTVLRNADWKDDFTLFGRLIKRSPNNPVGYLNYGENLFNQKRFSEALPYVEKGLGLSASSEDFKALAHLLLGNIYAESGNTNRAVQHYQEVIDNPSPNKPDYEAYCNLGLLYGKLGQLDKAREYLEKGVALNPYYAAGRRDLGVAYGMAGMTDKAIEQFRKALELDPDDKLALENLDYAVKLKEGN
jgi:tetratricopeptide (TPR) repeat protein